jgi:hypothetical protein
MPWSDNYYFLWFLDMDKTESVTSDDIICHNSDTLTMVVTASKISNVGASPQYTVTVGDAGTYTVP